MLMYLQIHIWRKLIISLRKSSSHKSFHIGDLWFKACCRATFLTLRHIMIWTYVHQERQQQQTPLPYQCKKCGQFVMPKTCENWLGPVNSCVYYARQTCNIYQVLSYSVVFKAPLQLWDPLSKTVLSKCRLIWNKGHVNIRNHSKDQYKGNLYLYL